MLPDIARFLPRLANDQIEEFTRYVNHFTHGNARSMQLTFSGSVPDTLVSSRNSATTTDNILLATFFSVDKDGFLATNGSTLTIQSNGAAFTATTIKIIAEQ